MRITIVLVIIFLLGNFIASSQTIAKQSFESSGDTWTPLTYSTPPCSIGNDIWDSVTSLPSISPSDGNQFWGIRDLDGSCGGSNYESIIFPNINISSFSNVIFTFDYNAIGLDNNEDLKYELFYDDVSQGEVIVVNGVGGNSDNTNGWLTETVVIPTSVVNIRVNLLAKNNQGNDRAGFDNVQLLASTVQNDNCITATSLIVGTSNTENIVTGSNTNAISSGELPNPTCASYNGNDVWFTAQVPASGVLTVETQNAGSNIDTGLAIYTGACGSLTQVACDDDSGPRLYSTLNINGLANTTVFIRVWAYNNDSSGKFNIVAYTDKCPFTTRWNNSGWNNGPPNSFTSAVINANYDTAIDGSFESCNCRVNTNRTLNIRADDYITVHNDLTVDGVMEVRHEGSLVMTNDEGQVSVSGTLNVHKTSTPLNNFRDFTYWSSPVNTTIDQAFVNVDPNRIYEWDIPSSSSIGDWSIASGSMEAARGYISEAPDTTPDLGTHSVTFTGVPNNGVIDIPIGFNDDGFSYSDYNLIGNPYPSPINIDDFIQSSSNNEMDGTIWIWTHNTAISNGTTGEFLGEDYATYNLTGGLSAVSPSVSGTQNTTPTNNIASGQGFFVKTTNAGTLSFQNAMRSNSPIAQFYRAPDTKNVSSQEKDRVWLNVESNTGGAFSQILIGFFENATDGYDRGYDGTKLGASWIDFYSKIDTLNYAVQGLSKFHTDKKVQLGFDTYISEPLTYKITISNTEGILKDNNIYLIDHELNITHDLKLADYEFDVNGEGYYPDRFTLQFKNATLNIDDVIEDNHFVVTNEDDTLLMSANSIITNLKIYDLMGRILIDKNPNSVEFSINNHAIKTGSVLVVNAILENNQSISKKVILY